MKYNYISGFIYLLGLIIGLIYFNYSSDTIIFGGNNQSSIIDIKNELTFTNIFYSNLKVVFINILGGLTLGILTFINLITNGIVLSYVLKVIHIIDKKLYLVLLPHSFEIIAYILSGAVGIELGVFLFSHIFLEKNIKLNLYQILVKILISVLIILISALTEVYISPNVI
jgi:uncharacterized membrane protein SpoIIM required for sporulation